MCDWPVINSNQMNQQGTKMGHKCQVKYLIMSESDSLCQDGEHKMISEREKIFKNAPSLHKTSGLRDYNSKKDRDR